MSVHIKSSPLEPFPMWRKLKQEDPLSPLLFIVVVKEIAINLKKVMDKRILKRVLINTKRHVIQL